MTHCTKIIVGLMANFGKVFLSNVHIRFWPTVLSVAPLLQHVVCLSVCLSSVCDVLYPGKTAGPICMKFSGKVSSDHGTTWLHFGSIRCRDTNFFVSNITRKRLILAKRLDRFAWMHHSFCIIVCYRAVRSAILATAGLLVLYFLTFLPKLASIFQS